MPVVSHGPTPCEPLTPNRSPVADRPAGKSPMENHFGEAIRRFRLHTRLSQGALAERSGVSVSTIRGMETGTRRDPQLASVRRLADALELRPAEQDELLAAAAGSAEPAAIPVPRQLPAPPAPFVGRHDELDRLDATLPSGSGCVEHRSHLRDRRRRRGGQVLARVALGSPRRRPIPRRATLRRPTGLQPRQRPDGPGCGDTWVPRRAGRRARPDSRRPARSGGVVPQPGGGQADVAGARQRRRYRPGHPCCRAATPAPWGSPAATGCRA
ncbi:helix-turn-helix transcriptional regulator [Streptomyces sanglieri]|uniref:Helix-turn-helix transcriptional regulator n=1 Tax=Streptomyces sanglieri TaxID=193460 RepID=A0ABW2WSI2_9ACTN